MSDRRIFSEDRLQEEFDRKGFVVVDLLDSSQVERLYAVGSQMPADVVPLAYASTVMSGDLDYRARAFEAIENAFAAKVRTLLADYRICYGAFVTKPGGDVEGRGVVTLHQDPSFVDESRWSSIGIWCPLVDVDEHNGCLRVVPGSHRLNLLPRTFLIPFPYSDLLPVLCERYLTSIPMKAGQAFVYSSALFHSSSPNRSSELRLVAGALAIPRESSLLYVTSGRDAQAAGLEIYRVDDDYYQRHRFDRLPADDSLLAHAPYRFEPLNEEILRVRLRAAERT